MKKILLLSVLLTIGNVFASELILPKVPVVLDGVYYTSSEYQEYIISNSVEVKHFVIAPPDYIKTIDFVYAFTTDKGRANFINVINKTQKLVETKTPQKYKTKIWTKPKYKGQKEIYEYSVYLPQLPADINNNFESIKVGKNAGWVILYDNYNYGGATLSVRSDWKIKDLNGINWGNRASSLKTQQINPE